jgi:regulator of protease activity HflC (stomatin/prohibitin superfamily)
MSIFKRSKTAAIIIGLITVIGVGAAITCIEKIPAGYVGGQFSMSKGVKKEVLSPGWHFVLPTVKVSKYSTATEQLYMSKDKVEGSKGDDSFDITCKDGKLNVDFEMSYSFNAEDIPQVMKRYRGMSGTDIINSVVRGKLKTFINEETSKFTVMDAHLEKKGELNNAIFNRLKKELASYGVVVESANLSQTRPDEKLATAIAERSEANQKLEKIKLEAQIKEQEAENKRIEAQGEADAKLIKAQGEAKANEVMQQSLTKELIELEKINKWNGVLPQVSDGQAIVNLR